jgi:hypothetical protein
VKLNKPQPTTFKATGLQNAREHLWREHRIGAPDGEKKGDAQSQTENYAQPSIMAHFKLNPLQPRDQQIANTLIQSFNKQYLQRLLIELIITANFPFSLINNEVLHKILEYLNPFVRIEKAISSSRTLRRTIYHYFNRY